MNLTIKSRYEVTGWFEVDASIYNELSNYALNTLSIPNGFVLAEPIDVSENGDWLLQAFIRHHEKFFTAFLMLHDIVRENLPPLP
jgi:hypothetical protein